MNREPKLTKIQEMVYELKVSDVMRRKVVSVTPTTMMSKLRTILRDERISGTPIIDGDKVVGMISIEDFINWLAEDGKDCLIRKKMSANVKSLYSDEPLVHVLSEFEHYGFGRFPVVDRQTGKLVGIVTKGTIIEGLLKELEIDYREEEIHHYRASHLFEDIIAGKTNLFLQYRIEGKDFNKGGEVASRLKNTLRRLGIHPDICRRAAIATYEAEMNVIFYADNGRIEVVLEPDNMHIKVKDSGPGIPDIEKAIEPGYSTAPEWVRELGFGAGMGLNNIQKCADTMSIKSTLKKGTILHIGIAYGEI